MKKFTLLSLMLSIALNVFSQDETLFDRINGVSTKDNIYLKLDVPRKGFVYRIDKDDVWHTVDDPLIFNVKNVHKNNFKVQIEFYNPLRYSIKSTVKDLDDPIYKTYSDFFAKLSEGIVSSDKIVNKNPGARGVIPAGCELHDFKKSNLLLSDWIFNFINTRNDRIESIGDGCEKYNKLVDKINKLAGVSDYLLAKINGKSLNRTIKDNIKILYECENNIEDFKGLLINAKKEKDKLKEAGVTAKSDFDEVIKILSDSTTFNANIGILFNPDADGKTARANFLNYSFATANKLIISTQEKFESNDLAIKKFEEILVKLDEHVKSFEPLCASCGSVSYKRDYDVKLDWKSQKMKAFEYSVSNVSLDGVEDTKSTEVGKFTVAKKLTFYPFISTGVFYSGLSYPNYAIAKDGNGLNKVASAPETKAFMRAAVYLNLLLGNWDPIYPFVQLGISAGNNDAIFPVGVGISLGSSFSISGGVLLGYRKELNKLQIGDTESSTLKIDDAILKNDLIDKGFASWYFSVHYNLSKK